MIAVFAIRQRQALTGPREDNVLPLSGRETGSFEVYLARIETLSRRGGDGFFVTAKEDDGPRFVQVSVSRDRGQLGYVFDIPVLDWSERYIARIEAEAVKRGLQPFLTDGGAMKFLDIDFETSGDHAVFARWVVSEVFGLGPATKFEIAWG